MVITTPSGYEVYLKEYFTFGQKRQLMKIIYAKMRIKPSGTGKAEVQDFSVDFMQELQDQAFKMIIEKIVIDKKEYIDGLYEMVMSWKEEDGQVVYEKIDSMTELFASKVKTGKKK